MCALGTYKDVELKYPSSHKEIMDMKNNISKFRLVLKPIHFAIRTCLNHMVDILKKHKLFEQGNNCILIRNYGQMDFVLTLYIKHEKEIEV